MNDPKQKTDSGVATTLVVQIHMKASAEIQSDLNEHFIKGDM